MAKQNITDGFVGVRFDTDWLREFKSKYPRLNLSKAIRKAVYDAYPIKKMSHYDIKIRDRAKKQSELKELIEKSKKEYEDIIKEIEFYENLRDSEKNINKEDVI